MAKNNESISVGLMDYQIFKADLNAEYITKLLVATLMTTLSVYVNCIMFYALMSKCIFKETPRYILFAHMLFNDSVHLLLTTLLYILALAFFKMAKSICSLLIFLATATFRNAPLNLAVMSLERYVAICFPLRHAEIATQKKTCIAVGFIWFLGSVNILSDIFFAAIMDPNFFSLQMFCMREQLFIKPWQLELFNGLSMLYFVSVSLIILFTYVCIMITARSVSSNSKDSKDSAKKAHRTVLLHFIQLGLCLTSFLYGTIERALYMMSGSDAPLFQQLRFLNYLFILILPRCLSPLIYGLRDEAVRPLFTYYFCYQSRKFQTSVNAH